MGDEQPSADGRETARAPTPAWDPPRELAISAAGLAAVVLLSAGISLLAPRLVATLAGWSEPSPWPLLGLWFVTQLVPLVAFAVLVAWRARDRRGRASALALVAVMLLLEAWMTFGTRLVQRAVMPIETWLSLGALVGDALLMLAPLAWGVARRRGWAWVPIVIVAPLAQRLILPHLVSTMSPLGPTWQLQLWWASLTLVPQLLAGLAAWLVDLGQRRVGRVSAR